MNTNDTHPMTLPPTQCGALGRCRYPPFGVGVRIATIAAIVIVTSIPFAYAYLTTPPDKQFMGIMVNVPDHAQYFSWMRELLYG